MSNIKCDMAMRDGDQRWIETFYRTGETLPQAHAKLIELGEARVTGLTGTGYMDYTRVSDVAIFGDSKVEVWGQSSSTNPEDAAHARDVRGVGVNVRLEAGTGMYRRTYFVRGMPDDWCAFTVAGREKANANQNQFLDRLMLKLVGDGTSASGWCLRALSKDAAVTQPAKIVAANFPDNMTATLTLDGPVPALGEEIKIRGCRGTNVRQLNGIHVVFAVVGQIITIKKRFAILDVPPIYLGKGQVLQRVYTYVAIDRFDVGRFRSRAGNSPT